MTREKDHSAALDGLRERLLESVHQQCALLNVDRQFNHRSLANERRARVRTIAAQIRALDAVRQAANSAERSLEVTDQKMRRGVARVVTSGGRW